MTWGVQLPATVTIFDRSGGKHVGNSQSTDVPEGAEHGTLMG
ncbi:MULTISPECIES: hypothetical protein [unclassified Actinobaculum]|nr:MULTISPECIES: hypothetical protein [unclassified Actinobaculum]